MTSFRHRFVRVFALALLLLALSASQASADPGHVKGHAPYVGGAAAADSPDDPGDVGP